MASANNSDPSDKSIEQFLTFELAGESYGVDILKVQEIRGWEPIRKIPKTPAFIKGALNLRGAIVPIIDLRERFGMMPVEYSTFTVVIIVSIKPAGAQPVTMGVVADAVSDVLDVKTTDIKKAPDLGSKVDTRYMRGMYVGKQSMVMLLNVEKLLNPEEFEGISGIL
ncbi:MAG: chemotaxis protein CheW [Gammaproteobacteria bacterium]